MLNYNKSNISLAKALRKNMTSQEKKLWYQYLRSYPIRFQRQKAIDHYIADFYCAKVKLIIELDGSSHYTDIGETRDLIRTEILQKYGLQVIRFSNLDVDKNFPGVCERIDETVREFLEYQKNNKFKKSLPQSRRCRTSSHPLGVPRQRELS